jgi:hypothetical protein
MLCIPFFYYSSTVFSLPEVWHLAHPLSALSILQL